MAGKKKFGNKKRGGVKSRRMRNVAQVIPRQMSNLSDIFPTGKVVYMPYSETITLDPGAGAVLVGHAFGCNNALDPNATTGGHSAMLMDQLSVVYGKFVIVGSKITATFCSQATTTTASPYMVGIYNDYQNTGLPVTYEEVTEMGTSSSRIVSFRSGGGDPPYKLTSTYSAVRDIPCSDPLDEPNQFFDNSSPPTIVPKWRVWAGALNNSTDMGPISVFISISYTVRCIKTKSPGLS